MNLHPTLFNKFREYLMAIPDIHRHAVQQDLLSRAKLDSQVLTLIQFTSSAAGFCTSLVSTLFTYGCLGDGRSSLEAVLLAAAELVPSDKQTEGEALIQELRMLG